MPYKDPERHREYDRERRRLERAGASHPSPTLVLPEIRLRVAADALALLERAVGLVESDAKARPIEKGRALGYLASVALRAVEASQLATQLEEIKAVLGDRQAAAKANGRAT